MDIQKMTKKDLIELAAGLEREIIAMRTATSEAQAAFAKSQSDYNSLNSHFNKSKGELDAYVASVRLTGDEAVRSIATKSTACDAAITQLKKTHSDDIVNYIENNLKASGSTAMANLTATKTGADKVKGEIDLIKAEAEKTNLLSKASKTELEKTIKSAQEGKDTIDRLTSELLGDEGGNHNGTPATKKLIENLSSEVSDLKDTAVKLNTESESFLKKMTDGGLHSAFSERARNYTIGSWAILILQCTVLGVMAWLAHKAINVTELEEVLKHLFPTIPLGILVYFLQRAFNVEKKLAEEYQHKSTLTKTLAGYRSLYKLAHEDEEYMALFRHIKDGISRNPSDEINPILHRRLPLDQAADTVETLVTKTSEAVANGAETIRTVANVADKKVIKVAETVIPD